MLDLGNQDTRKHPEIPQLDLSIGFAFIDVKVGDHIFQVVLGHATADSCLRVGVQEYIKDHAGDGTKMCAVMEVPAY